MIVPVHRKDRKLLEFMNSDGFGIPMIIFPGFFGLIASILMSVVFFVSSISALFLLLWLLPLSVLSIGIYCNSATELRTKLTAVEEKYLNLTKDQRNELRPLAKLCNDDRFPEDKKAFIEFVNRYSELNRAPQGSPNADLIESIRNNIDSVEMQYKIVADGQKQMDEIRRKTQEDLDNITKGIL